MKWLSYALNVLLAVALCYVLFFRNDSVIGNSSKSISLSSREVKDQRAGFSTCYNCDSSYFYGLKKEDLLRGIARYATTHWALINKNGPDIPEFQDSRACLYTLDTLKKFICQIENYTSHNAPARDLHSLGIRFFYAVYPKPSLMEENDIYGNHMTLFMVPTYDGEDFDPRTNRFADSIDPSEPMMAIGWEASDPKDKSSSPAPMAKNQGQLCPPKCTQSISPLLDATSNKLVGYDDN